MVSAELAAAQDLFSFFGAAFKGFEPTTFIQRGVVGAVAIPGAYWIRDEVFKPAGSVPWFNARTAECLKKAEEDRAIACRLEGRAAALQAFLGEVLKTPAPLSPSTATASSAGSLTTSDQTPPTPPTSYLLRPPSS